MKTIGEIIQGHPLFFAKANDNVRDAVKLMSDKNVGAVAVLESDRLVGIFSERDLMKRVVAVGLDPGKTIVSKVMTKDLVVGRPDDDITDAMQKMHSIGCRHLPVVDGGRIIGMLSLRDLLEIDDDTQRKRASFLRELVTYSPDYES
ncbi:MAG TPA: CBS domain-containing protein [Thermoanaerobaculia bacterium]|jgi:CBS domain-containing protein|nr:CBS domain-containing protein [Thermoanaerobaculia bacterium]